MVVDESSEEEMKKLVFSEIKQEILDALEKSIKHKKAGIKEKVALVDGYYREKMGR